MVWQKEREEVEKYYNLNSLNEWEKERNKNRQRWREVIGNHLWNALFMVICSVDVDADPSPSKVKWLVNVLQWLTSLFCRRRFHWMKLKQRRYSNRIKCVCCKMMMNFSLFHSLFDCALSHSHLTNDRVIIVFSRSHNDTIWQQSC